MLRTPATESRYSFYRMGRVNPENERTTEIKFPPWMEFEPTTSWSTVQRFTIEQSPLVLVMEITKEGRNRGLKSRDARDDAPSIDVKYDQVWADATESTTEVKLGLQTAHTCRRAFIVLTRKRTTLGGRRVEGMEVKTVSKGLCMTSRRARI